MRVPIFGFGQASKSPFVTAKQLTNIYAEQRPQGEKAALVGYGTPGLDLFADVGGTPARGGIEFPKNNVSYFVHRSVLWEVNNAGVMTNRGTLNSTSGRVSMAHNGVQIMIVDGTDGYIYNTVTTAFVEITDAQFPANATTCCFLNQRFIISISGSSRFYWSDIDDGLAWDALSFANAESNPDEIVSVYASNGQLILLGPESTEFWGTSGVADPAFIALQGNASEWGLAARWSIARYDNSFACLMKNRMSGEVMIAQMNGYLPKKLSSVDLDSIINGYGDVSNTSAYSYMLGGHPMLVTNYPTVGASWLLDGSTGIPTKLQSDGITRHLGEFSFSLLHRTVIADYSVGRLYTLNPESLTDNGASIVREIIGETVCGQDGEFFPVDCLRLDMEVGVGLANGQGSNPQIALSVSRDNGNTYGPEMWKPMGAMGQYRTRVEWRRLGTPRYFTPKIRLSDPVRCAFVSACINPVT